MKNTRAEYYLDLFNDLEKVEHGLLHGVDYSEVPDSGPEDKATTSAIEHIQAAKCDLLDAVKAAVVTDIERS